MKKFISIFLAVLMIVALGVAFMGCEPKEDKKDDETTAEIVETGENTVEDTVEETVEDTVAESVEDTVAETAPEAEVTTATVAG